MNFGADRLRPALDLLGQIQLDEPKRIVDLGCGPGNVTDILSQRWADAHVVGVDSSPEMLAKASVDYSHIDWQEHDVSKWQPDGKFDLIYSNACLHWLDNHNDLFPRLMSHVLSGGMLAVQMPNNFAEPTHQLIREVLGANHPLCPGFPVHEAQEYYGWLSGLCRHLNIWEKTYMHVLEGENPVADWTKGAALRPILDGLKTDQEKQDFENDYRNLIKKAYPKSANGKTLMPFKRLFIVALA